MSNIVNVLFYAARILILGSVLLYALSYQTYSQEVDVEENVSDTTKVPAEPVTPMKEHGSLYLVDYDYADALKKSDIQMLNHSDLGDVYFMLENDYLVNNGYFGLFSNYSKYGSLPSGNQFLYNGREYNDNIFGLFDLSQYPQDFFERIEELQGSEAIILGENSTGSTRNIQEIRYNTGKPYTKIWYFQGPNRTIGADGVFSQNFHPKLNLTLGARSLAGNGRFENTQADQWNIRSLLRYNHNELTSMSLNWQYFSLARGLYGGMDYAESDDPFSPLDAFNVFENLNERSWRNELDVNFTTYLDSSKTTAFATDVYFRNNKTLRNSKGDFLLDGSKQFQDEIISNSLGFNSRIETFLYDIIAFKAGINAVNREVPSSAFTSSYKGFDYTAFASGKLYITKSILLSGGFKTGKVFGQAVIASGFKADLDFSKNFTLFLDFSNSQRAYTPNEMSGIGKENHLLAIAGVEFKSYFNFKVEGFFRNVSDMLLFSTVKGEESYSLQSSQNDFQIFGVSTNLFFNIKDFEIRNRLNFNYDQLNNAESNVFPLLSGNIDLAYKYQINQSIIRGGVSFYAMTPHKFFGFSPLNNVFTFNDFESNFMTNGANAYISMRLGSAFVKASYMNMLNQGYYFQTFYPLPNRHFRFSVSWAFFD